MNRTPKCSSAITIDDLATAERVLNCIQGNLSASLIVYDGDLSADEVRHTVNSMLYISGSKCLLINEARRIAANLI